MDKNNEVIELLDNSLTGRIVSIFPLALSATLYYHANGSMKIYFEALSVVLLFAGIATIFCKGKVYFDKGKREIIRLKQWLFIKNIKSQHISNYTDIDIDNFSSRNRGGKEVKSYSVVVRHKNGTVFNGYNIHLFNSGDWQECMKKNEYYGKLFSLPYIRS